MASADEIDLTPPEKATNPDLLRWLIYNFELAKALFLAGGSGGAPTTAEYITVSVDGGLSAERTAAVTSPIVLTDGGANNPITWSFDQTVVLGNNARVAVRKNSGAVVGTRRRLNLVEGGNITLTVADDGANEEVDVTVAATVPPAVITATQVTVTLPYPPQLSAALTVVDAAIGSGSKVLVTLAGTTPADINEIDTIDLDSLAALPTAGSMTVQMSFRTPQAGPIKLNYLVAA